MKKKITVTIDERVYEGIKRTYDLCDNNLSRSVELLLCCGIVKVDQLFEDMSEYEILGYLSMVKNIAVRDTYVNCVKKMP